MVGATAVDQHQPLSLKLPWQTALTLGIEHLLLCNLRIIHSTELEGVFLAPILRIGDPHHVVPVPQRRQLSVAGDGLRLGLGRGRGTRANDDIDLSFGLEEGSNTRNDSDTHCDGSHIHGFSESRKWKR